MTKSEPQSAVPPPASCPFCRSTEIAAATEKVDASTYWRCKACGEMWNVARLHSRSSSNSRLWWK